MFSCSEVLRRVRPSSATSSVSLREFQIRKQFERGYEHAQSRRKERHGAGGAIPRRHVHHKAQMNGAARLKREARPCRARRAETRRRACRSREPVRRASGHRHAGGQSDRREAGPRAGCGARSCIRGATLSQTARDTTKSPARMNTSSNTIRRAPSHRRVWRPENACCACASGARPGLQSERS